MRYGYRIAGDDEQYWAQYHAVTEDYFTVLGTDLRAGRAFQATDRASGEPVVIINEALAQQHFPGVDPVGRSITILSTMHAIVGVARSTRHFGPDQAAPPEVYVPLAQNPSPFAHVLISAVDLPPGLLSDAVRAIDPYLVAPPLQP
jgi:hypothetical protein